MDEKTLEQLKKISKPKTFKKDEYIHILYMYNNSHSYSAKMAVMCGF